MTPDEKLLQRQTALQRANVVREYRAARLKELGHGRLGVFDLIDDPQFATAEVRRVLKSYPFMGDSKTGTMLNRAAIPQQTKCGALTARQRQALAVLVSASNTVN